MKGSGTIFVMCLFAYQAIRQYQQGKASLPPGYRLVAVLDGPGYPRAGYIAQSRSRIIAAFRGTEEREEWRKDLDASQVRYPYLRGACLTHKGFTDMYSDIRPALLAALARCRKGLPLLLTGHSLGGAVASLAALDPQLRAGRRSISLYTFGAPRVGNPEFASLLPKRLKTSLRLYHKTDWVPSMPPASFLGMHYQHAERGRLLPLAGGNPLRSHGIASYAASLAALAPEAARRLCSSGLICPPALSGGLASADPSAWAMDAIQTIHDMLPAGYATMNQTKIGY